MSTVPFQPVNEKSYADMLEGYVIDLPTGTILRYNDPDLPFSILDQRGAIDTVAKRLEKRQKRTLANVTGVGYRIVAGTDHVTVGEGRLRKTIKSAWRANQSIKSIDQTEMSGTQQARLVGLQERAAFLAKVASSASRTAEAAAAEAEEIVKEAQDIRDEA